MGRVGLLVMVVGNARVYLHRHLGRLPPDGHGVPTPISQVSDSAVQHLCISEAVQLVPQLQIIFKNMIHSSNFIKENKTVRKNLSFIPLHLSFRVNNKCSYVRRQPADSDREVSCRLVKIRIPMNNS